MTAKVKYNTNSKLWEVWTMIDGVIYSSGTYLTKDEADEIASDIERIPG